MGRYIPGVLIYRRSTACSALLSTLDHGLQTDPSCPSTREKDPDLESIGGFYYKTTLALTTFSTIEAGSHRHPDVLIWYAAKRHTSWNATQSKIPYILKLLAAITAASLIEFF